MQHQGRALRAGKFLKASLALLMATAIVGADLDTTELHTPGGSFIVHAVITPGLGGAAVEFDREWEEHVDFSVGIDEEGNVTVNGELIGWAEAGAETAIEIVCEDGTATVTVSDSMTGTVLCAASDVALSGTADRVCASGTMVHSLDID